MYSGAYSDSLIDYVLIIYNALGPKHRGSPHNTVVADHHPGTYYSVPNKRPVAYLYPFKKDATLDRCTLPDYAPLA